MGKKVEVDENRIYELYHKEGLSKKNVADELGVSEMTIVRRMEEYGMGTRTQSRAVAQNHASYYQTSNGYMVASDSVGGEKEWVRIHRLVAVAEYGYSEIIDKEVHHKNGVKWDNRPKNIEPLTSEEHRRKHFKGKSNKDR